MDIGVLPGKGVLGPHPKLPAVQIGIQLQTFETGLGRLIGITFGRIVNSVWIEDRTVRLEDEGSWSNDTSVAGGMGKLVYGNHQPGNQWERGLLDLINAQLKDLYDFDPLAPKVENTEPFSVVRGNNMFFQFGRIDPVPGQNYPQLGFKPYP